MTRIIIALTIVLILTNCSSDNSKPEPGFNIEFSKDIESKMDIQNFNAFITDSGGRSNGSESNFSRMSFFSEDDHQLMELVFYFDVFLNEKTYKISSPTDETADTHWGYLRTTVKSDTVYFLSETGNLKITEYSNAYMMGEFEITFQSDVDYPDYTLDAVGDFIIEF